MHITYDDKEYLITHGGIPYFPDKPLEFFSSNTYIYGSLSYDVNIDKLYDDFMKKNHHKVYQVHGHRNKQNIKANKQFESENSNKLVLKMMGKNIRENRLICYPLCKSSKT